MRNVAVIGLLATAAAVPVGTAESFSWPQGRRAAIVLTYDDALAASHLDVAGPQLERAGLKGTFFLSGKSVHAADVSRWRALAAAGHELGNHTVNHPCARGTFEMPAQYNTESYTVPVLLTEVGVMNALLTALDGKAAHAFATPCGHTKLGDGQEYLGPLATSGLVSSIRDAPGVPTPPEGPKVLPAMFTGTSGADMVAWVKEVERAGGLGIVVFHGVGGDYLSVTAEAHRELLDYLAGHRDTIWTATYSEAVGHAARRR